MNKRAGVDCDVAVTLVAPKDGMHYGLLARRTKLLLPYATYLYCDAFEMMHCFKKQEASQGRGGEEHNELMATRQPGNRGSSRALALIDSTSIYILRVQPQLPPTSLVTRWTRPWPRGKQRGRRSASLHPASCFPALPAAPPKEILSLGSKRTCGFSTSLCYKKWPGSPTTKKKTHSRIALSRLVKIK